MPVSLETTAQSQAVRIACVWMNCIATPTSMNGADESRSDQTPPCLEAFGGERRHLLVRMEVITPWKWWLVGRGSKPDGARCFQLDDGARHLVEQGSNSQSRVSQPPRNTRTPPTVLDGRPESARLRATVGLDIDLILDVQGEVVVQRVRSRCITVLDSFTPPDSVSRWASMARRIVRFTDSTLSRHHA